ncbi:MAG: tetratricopeptide repeat protein [Candidatus Rokubacteria bacterium]|nr:tetratricopeptide repeat protein [Candidatus Rokubacteria bacterium]MBI3824666.1 tetratricopeptide repeat protein [Candidatus Rokubacteria bacterium]
MNRGLLATALALAVLGAGCASPLGRVSETQALQARDAYERGLAGFRAGQTVVALNAFQEAIRLDPTLAVYHNALGLLYLNQMANAELALAEFERAAGIDAQYAEARLNIAIALAEQQRWEEAVTAYRRVLALPTLTAPDVAHQNLGLALYNLKRYAEAEAELRFALSLEPQMQAAYYHLALVFLAQNRSEDARLALRRTRDLDPATAFGAAAIQRLRALGE